MRAEIDDTHDPHLKSWVESADVHPDFPIQNLPLGVFSPGPAAARIGIAIGDFILDLAALAAEGLVPQALAPACREATLNTLLGQGAPARRALRAALSRRLAKGSASRSAVEAHLHPAADCTLHLPVRIGGYTDFYAGIEHATNVGRLFRPDNPLLPNYKYVPIGYHGRASTVRPSGAPVRRPHGQLKGPKDEVPKVAPVAKLDIELELGIWIGPGNLQGSPIPIGDAAEHIAGFCLLNDWSARDVQTWEYVPLGPFLAKNFATTVSPWIVTPEALAPFRIAQPPRPAGDPAPLPYLSDAEDQSSGALALELEVMIQTDRMRATGAPPERLSLSDARHLYWTAAQMVTHHTLTGCSLEPGDLLGTGTISGPTRQSCGSLLEMSRGGGEPLTLSSGETRAFLEDGDTVWLQAHARREGYVSIGFGACVGQITPALPA